LNDGKSIGRISHARGSRKQVVQIVLDGKAEQLRLSGSIDPEDDGTVRDQYQLRLRKVSTSVEKNVREDLYELREASKGSL